MKKSKLQINIEKKHVYFLTALIILFIGVTYTIAYGTNNPAVAGHSASEIDFNTDITVAGKVQATNFIGNGSQLTGAVPSGTVIFYSGTPCPSGWSEFTSAQGRVIVGMPSAGTLGGTVGTALSDKGIRGITDVPAHTHPIDPPNTGTSSSGSHQHGYRDSYWAENDGWWSSGLIGSNDGHDTDNKAFYWDQTTGAAGDHAHNVDIGAFTSGSTGSPSVDVTMPYIQLLVCIKD